MTANEATQTITGIGCAMRGSLFGLLVVTALSTLGCSPEA